MKIDLARHLPVVERLKPWWHARSEREQKLLAVLGTIALLWVLIVLIVQPIWAARNETIANIRSYESLTARLRLSGTITQKVVQRSGSPASILSASAAEVGLAPLIIPDRDQYRVTLTDAPYDVVLRWVANVEQTSHLRFSAMRLERRPATGFVAAIFMVRG